jgi:hypothetical protein
MHALEQAESKLFGNIVHTKLQALVIDYTIVAKAYSWGNIK